MSEEQAERFLVYMSSTMAPRKLRATVRRIVSNELRKAFADGDRGRVVYLSQLNAKIRARPRPRPNRRAR